MIPTRIHLQHIELNPAEPSSQGEVGLTGRFLARTLSICGGLREPRLGLTRNNGFR
jgi:hypothetical protein